MRLPVQTSCCGCASLTTGAYILGSMAICGAFISIVVSSCELPRHATRAPEDNLIGLVVIMNSTLSVIFNIVLLVGVYKLRNLTLKGRPGHLQVSMLFNALFVAFCCVLVLVKCLFSPEYLHACFTLAHALLGALLVTAANTQLLYHGLNLTLQGRPGHLQVSMLFNALFVAFCCVLVLVKCLFSPEYLGECFTLAHALLGALLVTAATIFCIYYFLIINSLHLRMKQGLSMPTPVPV